VSRAGRAAVRAAGVGAALAALAFGVSAGAQETAALAITVVGVEDGAGVIRADVYDRAETFREPEHAVAALVAPARPGTLDLEPVALPAGRYAVIVYHDEDNDGALDRFLGMMPTEGYGVSTNPTLSGPPDFDDTAVTLPPTGAGIRVEMRY
jgi:uncharacterized protein (DUF2141 family)